VKRFLLILSTFLLVVSCVEGPHSSDYYYSRWNDGDFGSDVPEEDPDEPEPSLGDIPVDLPVLRITTDGGRAVTSTETYIEGKILLDDRGGIYSPKGTIIRSDMKIRGRGKSTWTPEDWPKRPYKIKLAEKTEVLGMPANKDWALITNYVDRTLLRNHAAMEISRILGFAWTPQCRSVEVYFNDTYQGVYDIFEHKEVAKHKVNIKPVAQEATGDDIKGDYYLEVECSIDKPHYFTTSTYGVPIQFKNPEEPTQEQMDYVIGYLSDFESALFSDDFADPDKGYAKFIDIDSFINNYIIQELSKNYDGTMRKSTFLTLEKGVGLRFYHVWDYDICFGNTYEKYDYAVMKGEDPTGWWIRTYGTDMVENSGWYYRLFQDPAFAAKVKARWNQVYTQLQQIPTYVNDCATAMGAAVDRNFEKWPVLYKHVWPGFFDYGSYQEHVDFMTGYYTQRLEWINQNI